jgi:hypothetical protein
MKRTKWRLVVCVTAAAVCALGTGGRAWAGEAASDNEGGVRVELGGGLCATFDSSGRLSLYGGKGKDVLVRQGGLRVQGETALSGQEEMSVAEVTAAGAERAWSLTGSAEAGSGRALLRAFRLKGALAVAAAVNFRRPEKAKRWGYFLELPEKVHAGAELRVGGRRAVLPAKAVAGKAAVLLRGRGRSLVVARGKKVVLRILRDVPAGIEVRDLRAAGGGGFGVVFEAGPADLAGRARGRFCLGFSTGSRVDPLIYHARAWPPVRDGGPIRVEIGVLAEYRSAFNPAEVKVDVVVAPPGGELRRRPAFYAQEYVSRITKVQVEEEDKDKAPAVVLGGKKEPELVEREVLEAVGEAGWRALVDAEKVGVYGISVEVSGRGASARAEARPVRILRAAGKRMGPLAKSTKDHRFLADPQGKAVFLLGHNLGWLVDERGPLGLHRWTQALERMSGAGLNYARIWNCSWSLWLETHRPYRYDLASAWKLDRVLEEAGRRGIHVQLCMDNFHDFRMKPEKSPYFAGEKPVCRTRREFFTSAAARRVYSAKLRYMVARYGHHRNLMAWELWNELDYCIEKNLKPEELEKARKEYLVPWARRAARELAALDRRRRMVTCSLADGTIWPELSGAPEIGLVESHIYLYMPDPERNKPAWPARLALEEATGEFAKYRKPGFVSEFGFGASGGPESPINETDRLGVHLHNGLWSSALSGHAGVVALWWWDSYLAPPGDQERAKTEITGEDRYWHYRAVSRFLRGVDWLAGWKDLSVSPLRSTGRKPLITGMRTESEVLVWIADPANSWYNRSVKKYKPAKISGVTFSVDGLIPGQYQVTWWDTYSGKERTSIRQRSDEAGSLRIRVPTFSRDVAARIKLVERRRKVAGGGGE